MIGKFLKSVNHFLPYRLFVSEQSQTKGQIMVKKVTQYEAKTLVAGFHVPLISAYFVGSPYEKFQVGKLVLSIKLGKRRKLVTGTIVKDRTESGGWNHPGYNILKFVPNSMQKFNSLVG